MKKNMYELTNPQKSIWITEKYFQNTTINNICGSLIIKQDTNLTILNQAINIFIQNNDSFKLRFKKQGANLAQYFSKDENYNFEILNIEKECQIEIFAKQIVNTKFDIINSRVFDFKLFKLSSGFGGFIVNTHHIIADAATFSLIGTEIVQIYSTLLNKKTLTPKSYSYIDYIHSEKEYLKSSRYEKDKLYWQNALNPLPEIATIPSTNNSTSIEDGKAMREEFILNAKTISKIKDFCTKNKISIFNFLISVYSIYIGRINNIDKFLLGTPILNRTNFAEKHTSGMFISTSLLNIDTSNNLTFDEFVKNISSNTMQMLRHQKYNYQHIIEDIRKKDNSISKLYDVLISYQITQATDTSSEIPYETKWYGTDYIANSLEIHFHDNNNTGNLFVEYDYKAQKYLSSDIKNIHERILNIINQVLENNTINIDNISIISENEKNDLLNYYKKNIKEFNYCNNIFEQIKNNSKNTLNNIAIETENEKITYDELITRVNKLSNYLLNKKISKNIGIFTSRNIDTIIGILAIINIGSTYVPIDPEYPASRIEYMISNSKIGTILITEKNNLNKKINAKNKIHYLDINYNIYDFYDSNFDKKINYDINNNLYIVFTSGSTGNPKGITITHKNMMNLIYFEKNCTDLLNEKNRILQFATMSFDVSYQEIFSALLTNSCLVLTTEEIRKDMNKLSNYIFDKKIDTLFIPPAYLRILVEDENILDKLKNNLKNIITAGEQLVITDGIKKLILNGIKINNHYGPAETHVATSYVVNEKNITLKPPIGYPISNTSIYILDNKKRLCPKNIIGEIAISGDCVGNGYINNENLNKSKFIIDPFTNKKMYLTGDLGYLDENYCVHYIGRSDFQVKINGFRIELEEIDKILLQHPSILNAVSIIKEFNNKKYIITYYSLKNDLDKNDLLEFLKNKLPNYMLPFKLICVPKINLTLNGKIDKKSLPNFDFIENDNFVGPKTENEIKLAEIWKNIFNVEKISTTYDFFELGGDSLLAIKLCAIIQEKFNVEILVKDIFDNSKFNDLLYLIENSNKLIINKIPLAEKNTYYNLSCAQKGIYYAVSMDGNSSILYNLPGGILFDKMPDIEKLENCFNILINRHEAFRTYFETENNNVVQKIAENINFKINIINKNIDELNNCFEEFVKPFDLSKPPLLRADFINFEDEKYMLLFDTHHIIVDGSSIKIFINELCDLYNDNDLSELKITYKDFAVWENNILQSNKLDDSKNYWVEQLKGEIPILNLPIKTLRPSSKSFKGAKIYKTIPKNLVRKIDTISQNYNVTPYMITLAAYYILLSKYSMQEDIIVGSPVVGRNNSDLTNIIGMFVNTLPLRINIDSELSFEQFLYNVKDMCLNSFEHQTYPLQKILDNINISRDNSRNPLFDVLFTYQNNGQAPINLNGINAEYYLPDTKISKFDLSLEIIPNNDKLKLNFEYCSNLFTSKFINTLAEHYLRILKTVVQNIDTKLYDIDMLSPKEKQKILFDFNNSYIDYPKNKSLVDLFKEQVKKYPENIAVQFGEKSITYKELDEKSNTLSLKILEKNLNNEDVVGVYMNKSIELIISIWAILKCGLGYMPMYTGYPQDRLQYMIENSECKLILTKNNFINNFKQIENTESNKSIINNCDYIIVNNFEQIENTETIIEKKINPNNLAYVIYTSGSTGRPKGVKITHKCLNNYVHSFNELFNNILPTDKLLSSTNISFDVSIWEFFLSILNGATLVLYEEEIINDIFTYCKAIVDYKITTLYIPPNILNDVFLILRHKKVKIEKLLVGVEPIKRIILNKFYKLNPHIRIVNGYGPTETTICSTALDYIRTENLAKTVPIGKPIGNTKIYIVDKHMHIVPIGVAGEICIAGDGVGLGYINNEAETNKNFIENIFDNSSKLYKTGDLAKWNNDGNIYFVGRKDSQIKLSGYRIELKEIDNTILRYPSLIKVLTKLFTNGDKSYLVTYFTATEKVNLSDLKLYLQNKLAFYMVPKTFIQLDAFPLTINGKIDVKKLPDPILTSEHTYEPPSSPLEKKLCEIWENLFGIEKIGVNDNFFELGGDSLSAIRMQVETLNKNLNIAYSDIFSYPTIKLLAHKASNFEKKDIKEDKYSYSNINKLLNYNIKENIPEKIELKPVGNALLTGATGFLGAHILDAFLSTQKDAKIYCLVRNKNNLNPLERLKDTLQFYFPDKYTEDFDTRIKVINADLTKPKMGLDETTLKELSQEISVVINSAALVKHYGDYSKFNLINVIGTQNIIKFCKKYNKKLYHISTTSVSGMGLPENNLTQNKNITYFAEKDLFKNQNLNNAYIKTKFEAEKIVLEETLHGLNACIFRMGNISNRFTDAKFQRNAHENAFVNRIGYVLKLGVIQNGFKEHATEFAPVDLCATAIMKIIESDPNFTVFHIFNDKLIKFTSLINFINDLGMPLDFVCDKDFSEKVTYFLNDPKLKNEISGIVTDLDSNKLFRLNANILLDSDFSISYLRKLGFEWPEIDENYIRKYMDYFKCIGLF